MADIDPRELGKSGRRFYESTTDRFELEPHELELLFKAAQLLDTYDDLTEIVEQEGYIVAGAQGDKIAPAQVERRAVLAQFERILRTLDIPELDK